MGKPVHARVDTDRLSDEDARMVMELLGRIDFDAVSQSAPPAQSEIPDAHSYDIRLIEDGNQRRAAFDDATATPELRALAALVLRLSQPREM